MIFALPIIFTFQVITATYYHPVASQCQGDPTITASGAKIDTANVQQWCALSRDLLSRWGGQYNYGDTLTLLVNGSVERWVIQDCMNSRFTNKIDFLQPIGQRKNCKFVMIIK